MTKDEEGYNGWTNYETWNIALWVDNEYEVYRYKLTKGKFTAKTAEEFCREVFPNGTPDMLGKEDLVKVNWQEVSDNWNEE